MNWNAVFHESAYFILFSYGMHMKCLPMLMSPAFKLHLPPGALCQGPRASVYWQGQLTKLGAVRAVLTPMSRYSHISHPPLHVPTTTEALTPL